MGAGNSTSDDLPWAVKLPVGEAAISAWQRAACDNGSRIASCMGDSDLGDPRLFNCARALGVLLHHAPAHPSVQRRHYQSPASSEHGQRWGIVCWQRPARSVPVQPAVVWIDAR